MLRWYKLSLSSSFRQLGCCSLQLLLSIKICLTWVLKLVILISRPHDASHAAVGEVCWQDRSLRWWMLCSYLLLVIHQLDGAVLSLACSPLINPSSEDVCSHCIVGLLLFHLLKSLLQLDDLLRLSVKTLLSECFLLLLLQDLHFCTSSLGPCLEEVLALALVL